MGSLKPAEAPLTWKIFWFKSCKLVGSGCNIFRNQVFNQNLKRKRADTRQQTSQVCCVSWHFHYVICKTFKTLILNVNNNSFRSPIIAGNEPQTPRSKMKNEERDQFQGIWILEIKLSLPNNLGISREIPFAKSVANLNSLNSLGC